MQMDDYIFSPNAAVCVAAATERTADNPHAQLAAMECASIVGLAVAGLTNTHRRVIVWRYQERLTFRQIAQRLRVSVPAARQMHARALARLKVSMSLLGVPDLQAISL